MTSDVIAKVHQTLALGLSEQETGPENRGVNFKLAREDVTGEETVFVRTAHADLWLSDAERTVLADGGFLLDAGKASRISWGKRNAKEYVLAVAWTKVQEYVKNITVTEAKVVILERRVRALTKEVRDARESSANDVALRHLIEAIEKSYRTGTPKVATKPAAKRRTVADVCEGVATLVLSDWHYGESVNRDSVNGLNEYDVAIAERRSSRIFDTTLELLNPQEGKYDALNVPILGDMLSGIIHDELLLTNDGSLIEHILGLTAKLESGLFELAQHFPAMVVSCVFGNHGRTDKKKTFKNQAELNYETLVYRLLESHLKARLGSQYNLMFKIGTSSDVVSSVYGKKFLYTHGDQFSDYDGSALDKVRKGDAAKRKRAHDIGQNQHDYLVCGHFHNYGSFGNIIMNGSLVGYNEFAFVKNLGIERPQQALFVSHPQYGITKHMAVFGDEPSASALKLAPVSVEDIKAYA